MGDFIELALEGSDKLIDKHFDKVPDKYIHADTYKPKRMRKGSKDTDSLNQAHYSSSNPSHRRHHRRERERSPSPPYPQSDIGMDSGRPRNGANSSPYLQDGPFVAPPLYSNLPPHPRSEYLPVQTTTNSGDRRRTYDDDDDYYSPPRRPGNVRRRSSSYHGPRRNSDFYSSESEDERDQQLTVRHPRRGGSHSDASRRRDRSGARGLEDKVKDQFTNSKEGLAGGALGAVISGWAAHKALESRGKDRSSQDAALTLLSAAVGGLAVNAIVDKWEDRKAETKIKEDIWEDKWGDDGGRRHKSSRRDRDYEQRY